MKERTNEVSEDDENVENEMTATKMRNITYVKKKKKRNNTSSRILHIKIEFIRMIRIIVAQNYKNLAPRKLFQIQTHTVPATIFINTLRTKTCCVKVERTTVSSVKLTVENTAVHGGVVECQYPL